MPLHLAVVLVELNTAESPDIQGFCAIPFVKAFAVACASPSPTRAGSAHFLSRTAIRWCFRHVHIEQRYHTMPTLQGFLAALQAILFIRGTNLIGVQPHGAFVSNALFN